MPSTAARMRTVGALAAAVALLAAPAAGAKHPKPAKVGASLTITAEPGTTSGNIALYRFSGVLSSPKRACRADRQVYVALSTDGAPAAPDPGKGSFSSGKGAWASVYDSALFTGHSYGGVASVKARTAHSGGKTLRCKAASSSSVTVTP